MGKWKPKNLIVVNHSTDSICQRLLAKPGAYEMALGLPGWRWFGFDTMVEPRYFYVNAAGEVKAGKSFRNAEKVEV